MVTMQGFEGKPFEKYAFEYPPSKLILICQRLHCY